MERTQYFETILEIIFNLKHLKREKINSVKVLTNQINHNKIFDSYSINVALIHNLEK